MKKKKVLFVVLQLDAGGSERVVFDLARSLDPDNFEVYVAAFKSGVLAIPLKEICKEVFFIEKKRRIDIMAMFKLANIVKSTGIDLVNAHHYMPCFYSFLGTKVFNRIKLIYTEHSVPEVNDIASCIHGKIFYWMLYRINAVVGVSKAIAEQFKQTYPRHSGKFYEIVNGVDIDKFSEKGFREGVRSKWGLAKEHFVVGTVANFRKVKNHVCLVRAAAHLKDSYPQLRLFFAGTGFPGDTENSEDEVRALIHELGLQDRVILAGYQENISETLSAFDAFCLPSLSEGLPVSLLEAMAAGVPVIGSEVPGIIEVISHRKTGLLYPSNNDDRLALLLEELMVQAQDSKMLANNGLQYVRSEHSSKSWIEKYEKLFAA